VFHNYIFLTGELQLPFAVFVFDFWTLVGTHFPGCRFVFGSGGVEFPSLFLFPVVYSNLGFSCGRGCNV